MSPASEAARAESDRWVAVARALDPAPIEFEVTGVDPAAELARRGDRWGHRFERADLAEVCLFAAGLAIAEAEAWDDDDPIVATRAYEDRRFIAGDRVVWWAVPWAFTHAPDLVEPLLELGESLRLAPALAGTEGLVPPGHDTLGPLDDMPLHSVLSGVVLADREPTRAVYRDAAERWTSLAESWPGTAQMWLDLAARAVRSAQRVDAD
jgi:hypothetical protein